MWSEWWNLAAYTGPKREVNTDLLRLKQKHNRHDEGIVPYKETDCNSHMQRQERDEKIIVARELQVGEINRLIGLFMSLNILGAWTLTICIDNSHELVCGLYAQVY